MTFTVKPRCVLHVINKHNELYICPDRRESIAFSLGEAIPTVNSTMHEQSDNTSQSEKWLAQGGTAAEGMIYGPPSKAISWGKAGCPLLPRSYRAKYGHREAPSRLIKTKQSTAIAIAELDGDFLFRFGLAKLSLIGVNAMRNRIYRLSVPTGLTAIPAGVPLRWIMELPIRNRTRNAIFRIVRLKGTYEAIETPISCEEFFGMQSVGKLTVVDLLAVMESVEANDAESDNSLGIEKTLTANPVAIGNASSVTTPPSPILDHQLRDFAGWALAETNAHTFGDAVSEVLLSSRASKEWEKISRLNLHQISEPTRDPYRVLNSWVENLPVRETCVVRDRIGRFDDKRTLQELAEDLGTSRERIRQIEKGTLAKLHDFVWDSHDSKPIRWRIESIRNRLGVAAPIADVESMFSSEDRTTEYWVLLLEIAGPYDVNNGWVVLRSASANDPTRVICSTADEFGRIERDLVEERLSVWGLERSLHLEWLKANSRVRDFNGQIVLWGRNIGDRLAFALSDLVNPATVETLMGYIQEEKSRNSAVSVLVSDPRFVKVSPTSWALSSWNLPKYSGIAMSVSEILQHRDLPMPVDEVVSRVEETFGVPANSVRTCCQAPMFIIENGLIRLRADGEPYVYSADTLKSSQGIFALATHRVAIMLEIDRQILRGSGRAIGDAAGALLGLNPDERMVFHTEDGDSVSVTFPGTSISGPSLGSVRSIAERASAGIGHYLTLILDKSDMSAIAVVTNISEYKASWQLVERLTGKDAGSRMDGLALALQCPVSAVRPVLRSRGDDIVADALPAISASSRLEAALSDLEAQVLSM